MKPSTKEILPFLGAGIIYFFLSIVERNDPIGWTYPQMIIISVIAYCYLSLSQKIRRIATSEDESE